MRGTVSAGGNVCGGRRETDLGEGECDPQIADSQGQGWVCQLVIAVSEARRDQSRARAKNGLQCSKATLLEMDDLKSRPDQW